MSKYRVIVYEYADGSSWCAVEQRGWLWGWNHMECARSLEEAKDWIKSRTIIKTSIVEECLDESSISS